MTISTSRPIVLLAATMLAALVPLAGAGSLSAQELDRDRLEHVADSVAHHHLASDAAPGITVAVARDGEIVLRKGYGTADAELGVAAGPGTVYRIGSITKQFTSALVMRLVEAGELSLDDPITDYLPDYPTQGHTVTIRHLLNHTSGIKSYTGLGETFWGVANDDLSEAELIELFDDLPFDFEPGAEYRYNNSGYYLLGVIIGKVTGTPYADHLEGSLLEPLGLDHTLYCGNRRIVPERAEGYAYDEVGELVNARYISMANPGAAGAVCSTVGDLVRWTELLHDGEVVGASSLEAMTTPTVLASGDTAPYGFGLGLGELEDHRKVQHGGGINGFSAYLARYPEDALTIAVLTNSGSGDPGAIEDALARTIYGLPFPVIEDLPLTDRELQRYAGEYTLEVGGRDVPLRVFAEDGQLFIRAGDQSPDRLKHQGDGVFVPGFSNDVRFVFRGEGARADTVILQQGDSEYEGRRVN